MALYYSSFPFKRVDLSPLMLGVYHVFNCDVGINMRGHAMLSASYDG